MRVQQLDPILPEADMYGDRGCDLRSVQAAIDGNIRFRAQLKAEQLDSIAGMLALADAERIEGSICVATAGERNRKDHRGAQAPDLNLQSCSRRRAKRIAEGGSGKKFKSFSYEEHIGNFFRANVSKFYSSAMYVGSR